MEFKRITIHQIKKKQGITYTELIPSNSLIKIDENVENLIEKLNNSFSKEEKVIRTEFLEEVNDFQRTLKEFNDNKTDELFYEFTKSSINRINDLLTGVNLATGGYFVFTEYVYLKKHYAGVYLVRDTEEIVFDRSADGKSFVIDKTTVINTKNLAMAVRVDLGKFLKNEERYVHFTFKQADISEYFVTWIEVHLSNRSDTDTKALIALLNKIDPYPKDPDTNKAYEGEKFRNKVFDYIQSVGRVVKINELSTTFWGNPNYLSKIAEELGYDIDGEFRATSSILSRLKKYKISSGKISLGFSKSDIDNGRIYSGDGSLLIIDDLALKGKFDHIDD
jgi:nucleoid-associated protein